MEETKAATAEILRPLVSKIKERVDPRSFNTLTKEIDLYDDRYREGIIFYREYAGVVPDDETLEKDLAEMLEVYNDYYERCILNLYPDEPEEEIEEEDLETEDIDVQEESAILTEEEMPGKAEHPVEDSKGSEEDEPIEMKTEANRDEENERDKNPDIEPETIEWEAIDEVAIEKETAAEVIPSQAEPAKKTKRSISEAAYFQTKRVLEESSEAEETNAVERILERVENLVEEPADIPGTLKQIVSYITANGFTCEPGIVENLYLCLKAKPFVILTGIPGIGKSSLARLFSEAVGANTENGRYKQVPVRPDWKDSRGLLGYLDMGGRYIPGALNDFIKDAVDNPRKPYFLCLDEMNLARVEYYFSEILSVMETRRERNGRTITDPLLGDEAFGHDEEARQRYAEIYLPDNLYI
ncbi:MAG: DUF3578 domain-containing protein, partial [Eubacterium sp.]